MKMQHALKAHHNGDWEPVSLRVIPDSGNQQCKLLLSSSVRNADLMVILSRAELATLMLSLRSVDAQINLR